MGRFANIIHIAPISTPGMVGALNQEKRQELMTIQ
jgi:hypothetical protein